MKKLFLLLGLLVFGSSFCEAVQKYKMTVSTKTENVGYSILGSQKYEIGLDTASIPIITISSWTVNFGGMQVGTEEGVKVGTATIALNITAQTLPSTIKISTANINPASAGESTKYLSANGTWDTPAGAGDVTTNTEQTITAPKNFSSALSSTFTAIYFPNGINTGGKHFEIIHSTTFGTALTSYTVTGLNGDVDIRYEIRSEIIGSGTADNGVQLNDDSGANYFRMYQQGTYPDVPLVGSNGGATQIYTGYAQLGEQTKTVVDICAKTGYSRGRNYTASGMMRLGSANPIIINYGGQWNNTADNVTSMTFVGAFAAGTYIEIWALR